METQLFASRRFPRTSPLIASSAGLGWSGLSAELRYHRTCEAPTIVPRHVELILVVAGNDNGLVRRTGVGLLQEAAPRTGAIWLSPAGVGKSIAVTAPIPKSLHIQLPTGLFEQLSDDFNLPNAPAYSIRHAAGIRDGVIDQVGLSILSELAAQTSAGRVFVEAAALTLAARLIQNHCDSTASRPREPLAQRLDDLRLGRVLDYIRDNISKKISLADLAATAGYSPFHFTRMFTLAMGVAPARYVSETRLKKAMADLAHRTLPIAEIALNAQFSSQASFTRAFRRATGTTPAAFRRRPHS